MHRAQVLLQHLRPILGPASANDVAFKYSVLGGVLTQEQKLFYEENGYLLLRKIISPERMAVYTKRFLDISSGRVEKQPTMLMMRDITVAKQKGMGENSITKLQDFQDDEVLFSYCQEPAMLQVVQSIIGTFYFFPPGMNIQSFIAMSILTVKRGDSHNLARLGCNYLC
jgi:hypothetical protein